MKKLRYIFILLFVALISFSCGPGEGDIYENLLSGERIEILKIGNCQEIEESFLRINEVLERDSELPRRDLVQAGLYRPVANLAEDEPMNSVCFAYQERNTLQTDFRSTTGYIIIIDLLSELRQDFKRIN